jgi:hypothetical protein
LRLVPATLIGCEEAVESDAADNVVADAPDTRDIFVAVFNACALRATRAEYTARRIGAAGALSIAGAANKGRDGLKRTRRACAGMTARAEPAVNAA